MSRRLLTKNELGEAYREGIWCIGDNRTALKNRRWLRDNGAPEWMYMGDADLLRHYIKNVKDAIKDAHKFAKTTYRNDPSKNEYVYQNPAKTITVVLSRDDLLESGFLVPRTETEDEPPAPSGDLSVLCPDLYPPPSSSVTPVLRPLHQAKELFIKAVIKDLKKTNKGMSQIVANNQAHVKWEKLSPSEKEALRSK